VTIVLPMNRHERSDKQLSYQMYCHPERSEGPPSCRELQGQDAELPTPCAIVRHLLVTIIIAAVSLAPAARAQSKNPPVSTKAAITLSPALDDAQLYRNPTFGFRYQIKYGWVDRTKEMQQENEVGKNDRGTNELLLAVFEHPPEVIADTINSAVVIASESTAAYKGLKTAEDYLGPLTELATAKGFKPDGEPYSLEVESRQLLRADFVKTLNDKLTMHQCTLILLTKGQIVSFTFIDASEDDLDDLMDGLHFTPSKSPPH
jgi:hypothetical protein